MYDREFTEGSKGAIVEVILSLGVYRGDLILVGGWPPYFLSRDHFDHCGSVDIDLVLRPNIMVRYEDIRSIVEQLGYEQSPNVFRFKRSIHTLQQKKRYEMHLDFLTEPEAAQAAIEPGQLIEVQNDLKACLIRGSHVVFSFNYNQDVEGTLPADGEAKVTVPTADIVGSLALKGQALLGRFKDKDYYDIYAVAGYHRGGPQQAALAFSNLIKERSYSLSGTILETGLSAIKSAFSSVSRVGPVQVSRFIGADTSTDSYERVRAFIEATESDLGVRW